MNTSTPLKTRPTNAIATMPRYMLGIWKLSCDAVIQVAQPALAP
jgi:hypothetical protein